MPSIKVVGSIGCVKTIERFRYRSTLFGGKPNWALGRSLSTGESNITGCVSNTKFGSTGAEKVL